jgi:hypothetical protein
MARTFLDRLLGMSRADVGTPVLLPGPSIHTFGQRRPLSIIGLNAAMRVVAVRTVAPNRVVMIPGARMILELPAGADIPAMSTSIVLSHV